ncbi:MAG: thiol peroxidase [Phycisphaerae bacterium]|nr:thiol peroxidase [Phycisphaerae bacterium]
MKERKDVVTFQGNPLTLLGDPIAVGQKAPEFEVVANDLSPIKLSDYAGKTIVISVVPSLDTPVCDTQTRTFNEKASSLGDNVVILTLSVDLPFAQARWCGAAGVDRVHTLSDYKDLSFGTAYGLVIKELRLLTRAVLVVDKTGTVQYIQVVKEVTHEPDYKAVLDSVRALVAD